MCVKLNLLIVRERKVYNH